MSVSKDLPALEGSKSKKVVIGFSLSSKNAKSKSAKLKPPTSLGHQSRISVVDDEEDDNEMNSGETHEFEAVTGFGEDGAIKEYNSKGPLVIERLKNKDWKSELRAKRRQKDLLDSISLSAKERKSFGEKDKEHVSGGDVDLANAKENEIRWGLSLPKNSEKGEKTPSKSPEINEINSNEIKEEGAYSKQKPQTLDEEALQALLSQEKEVESSNLVITANQSSLPPEHFSEQDAFKRAIAAAPEPSTLEDYERIPVEEFGAALLRGMGWNGEKVGHVKETKRRQNLLGLGAKELKEAEMLGAWVNKSDTKRLKSGYKNTASKSK
ncbi:Pre-mRNA-splicing factor SPP2 [Golovinomyces cichoracearum]|uniref:Pre-mRNA-splicing factor n=1 Tax=Golovinomyces cichoracearum TaxID=62708 RepID=A0A420IYC9_9PEZI|nr:Pre-mRNA-splicing factor SPP2 [Golovinomyces cichoracearum]